MNAKNATAGNPPRFPRYTREQAKKDAADRIRRAAILKSL